MMRSAILSAVAAAVLTACGGGGSTGSTGAGSLTVTPTSKLRVKARLQVTLYVKEIK